LGEKGTEGVTIRLGIKFGRGECKVTNEEPGSKGMRVVWEEKRQAVKRTKEGY